MTTCCPQDDRPDAFVILGPTGSGKSALALELAARLPIEIISVDSALVYRGMDIGTAKPSLEERQRVPHHLIDLIEPTEAYSAARFVVEARAAIAKVNASQRIAVLVGGTMLYYKALKDGLDDLPGADPVMRAQIEDEARLRGWPALHAELAKVDSATASRLEPQDAQRIQRALEVFRLTSIPLSEWFSKSGLRSQSSRTEGSQPSDRPREYDALAEDSSRAGLRLKSFALLPEQRSWLHQRIAQRFGAMLEAGLLEEVERLRARGDLDLTMPSMRCVGYRQAWSHLNGDIDRQMLIEQGVAATRQLAKRQLTWLRRFEDVQALPAENPGSNLDAILESIEYQSR